MMRTRILTRLALAGALVAAVTGTQVGPATAGADQLAVARDGTAAFHNLDDAEAAGYGIFTDAAGIACIDKPGVGTMGVHYVRGAIVPDGAVDAANPEALVYEPTKNGRLRLVAVEYVVLKAHWDALHPDGTKPALFGRDFEETLGANRYGLPPYYSLHAWVWKQNPAGMFEDWNPDATCAYA
jgi:hypothetical protein